MSLRLPGGGVADGVRQLVSDPERQQFRPQAQSVGLGIDPPGEVLQADERHSPAVDHQFAGIRRAHAHHQHDVGRLLDAQHVHRARDRLLGDALEVDRFDQRVEVPPVGPQRRLDDLDRRRDCRDRGRSCASRRRGAGDVRSGSDR